MNGISWDAVAADSDKLASLLWQANEKLVELGKPMPGACVLDLACGTGSLILDLVERIGGEQGSVLGIDLSPVMLELASARIGDRPYVELRQEDAHAFQADASLDLAYCRMALPFFADPRAVLARVYAALRPGGRLAVMTIGGREHNEFFTAAERAAPDRLARAFEFGDETKLTHLLQSAGFERAQSKSVRAAITVHDPGSHWSTVRSALGIADEQAPSRVTPGSRLSLEVLFGLATKPNPGERRALRVKRFDDVVAAARRTIGELTPQELKRAFKKSSPTVFIDVREADERVKGKIKGAIEVPRSELELKLPQMVPDPMTPIVIYSEHGDFGALAASRAVSMGYEQVWNLYGGISAWREESMPIEVGG